MLDIDTPFASTEPVAYLGGSVRPPAREHSIRRAQPAPDAEVRLTLTDPAVRVVTDFVWEQPVTVLARRSIDGALEEMMRAGVGALLVVRDEVIIGLITSLDIQRAAGDARYDDIEVGHIMTPWERVPTLDWQALARARVFDVAACFQSVPASHIVLVEHADQGGTFVRGLVSRTRLLRQLGHSV